MSNNITAEHTLPLHNTTAIDAPTSATNDNTKNSGEFKPAIENAQAALELAREQLAILEKQVALARGTRDFTPPVVLPVVPPKPRPLSERVRDALTAQAMNVADLAKVLGEPVGPVVNCVRQLANDRRVHNVGTIDQPRWTNVVGDLAPNDVLHALIERLLHDQPMTTAEIVAATGAREARISGYLVHLQRTTTNLLNLGNARVGRWFLVPTTAKLAVLKPKRRVTRR